MSSLVKTVGADPHPLRGSDSDAAYADWRELAGGSAMGTVKATAPAGLGTNKYFYVLMVYYPPGDETANFANYACTYGNQSPDKALAYKTATGTDSCHWILSGFSAATIDAAADDIIRFSRTQSREWNMFYGFADEVDQATPWGSADANVVEGAIDSGLVRTFGDLPAVAGQAQVDAWSFRGTRNRVFTPDADWTTHSNRAAVVLNGEIGASYLTTGSEAQFSNTINTDQALFLCNLMFEFQTAAPAEQINDVNGDDIVRRNATANEINGSGFTGATGVRIGLVTQTGFQVVSDILIRFDTVVDSVSDLRFGAQTLTVVRPTTDLTHPITLFPEAGRDYVDVSGLPWSPTSRSIFEGLVPAVSNGDQCEYDSVTDKGNGVTVDSQGIPTISGGGTTPQTFIFCVWRSLDSDQWSDEIMAYINFEPMIISVSGDDITDVSETNVQIVGDHFGETQIGSGVYLNMVGQGFDGNEVAQPIAATGTPNGTGWSDDLIVVASWDLGALPGGTDMEVLVRVE